MSAYRILKHIETQAKGKAFELIVTTLSGHRFQGTLKSMNEYFLELQTEQDTQLFLDTGTHGNSVFIPFNRVDHVVPRWL